MSSSCVDDYAQRRRRRPGRAGVAGTAWSGRNMNHHPGIRRRHSIRLKGYDYSQPGAYFVTIVTQDRLCLFGDVIGGTVRLNGAGRLAQAAWERLPCRFPGIDLDAFVAMPNHIHGLIAINGPVGAPPAGARMPRAPRTRGRPGCHGRPGPRGRPGCHGRPGPCGRPGPRGHRRGAPRGRPGTRTEGRPRGAPLRWGTWWGRINP